MTALSLAKVEIDGFRGLRSLDLDGLGRVNILVGGNNSGKTSVLEALSILCQPYNPDEWLNMVRRRDFGRLDETMVQSLRWCFTQPRGSTDSDQLVEATCGIICQGNFPLRRLRVHYSEFTGEPDPDEVRRALGRQRADALILEETMRGAELVHFLDWSESSSDASHVLPDVGDPSFRLWERLPPLFRLRPRRVGPGLDCQTLTPYSYQTNSLQVRTQSKQIFQQNSSSTLELLRDFDADIEGIDLASFRGERPAIYIKHRKLGVAPLSVFGDAMRRSVLLAATLPSLKNGGVLLIDEVEAGIHVSALSRVFEWLVKAAQEFQVQVFVTTHSLEALDALISASPEPAEGDMVAFHLTQTDERTLCKRFSGGLLQRLRFERGLDVR